VLYPIKLKIKEIIHINDSFFFVCNRTRNEHFAYLKQAAKSNFAVVAFNDVILIFDTNQGFHFSGMKLETAEFIIRTF
jgi:hypothetical protein